MINKNSSLRFALYVLGMLVLALGISVNARTSLGVSPIVSVAYSISAISGWNFGNVTFLVYIVFVCMEIAIHLAVRNRKAIVTDILQIVVSLIFTRFLNLFNAVIPDLGSAQMQGTFAGSITGRILFLLFAILLTGTGAALSLNMRLVPNPGDGIVQTIGDAVKKDNGLVKNCVDITCVAFTCIVSLIFAHRIIGIGVGTLVAMIGVGRVIAVFNRLTREKTDALVGKNHICEIHC